MLSSRKAVPMLAALATSFALACGGTDESDTAPADEGNPDNQLADPPALGSGDGTGGVDPACVGSVAETGKVGVDIVFIVDNSGSMGEEMAGIRKNVNAFAKKFSQGGYDARVVMIANKGPMTDDPLSLSICVPQPLAGADCADNPGKFYHVDQDVGSIDSLPLILSTYDRGGSNIFTGTRSKPWNEFIRLESTKVFIEVTDDKSRMSAEDFDEALLAKAPSGIFGTAKHRKYVFHGIVSKPANVKAPSTAVCATASGSSVDYQKLSILTGGRMESVCSMDYSAVLDNIAATTTDRLACELSYPTDERDPSKVVVRFTDADSSTTSLSRITDPSKCGRVPNGWYYDDPESPSQIILCPSTCAAVNEGAGAKVEALVGCKAPDPR